jgi:hypothetical protein
MPMPGFGFHALPLLKIKLSAISLQLTARE